MADIVKRLRAINPWGDMDWPETIIAAVREIERLREEIDTWKSVFPDIAPDAVLPSRAAEIAAAVAAERERCAAVADGWSVSIMGASENSTMTTKYAEEIAQSVPPALAAAIRGGDTR